MSEVRTQAEQNLTSMSGVWGSSWLNKQEQCFWLITRPVSMFSGEPYTVFESLCRNRAGGPRCISTVQPEQHDVSNCPACEREWKKRFLSQPALVAPSQDRLDPPTSPPADRDAVQPSNE